MDEGGPLKARAPRRIPRKVWVLVALVALAAVILIRSNSTVLVNGYPRIDSYRVVDDRNISVKVAVSGRSWTRVTNVIETETDVRVVIESFDWPIPLPQSGALDLRELAVALRGDLAGRNVQDAAGVTMPRH